MAKEKNEVVSVDIIFNPDTKQLEKVVKEIDKDSKIHVKVDKPDIKQLEGPFKDLQEKFTTLANGGFSKGLQQFQQGFAEFKSIQSKGGDFFTSVAGGLSKIGSEGAIAVEGLAVLAGGTLAAGYAFASLYDKGTQLSISFKALGIDAKAYTDALNGVVNVEQAFAIRNAANTVGLRLNGQQLAELSNLTDTLGQQSGDLQGTQNLVTQALQGNKEAMYQLGIQYNQTDTEIQRATKSLDELSRRSREFGPKNLGFFEQIQVGFGRISVNLASVLNDAGDQYASILRTQQQAVDLSNQNAANAAETARREALARQDSENRSRLEQLNNQQQERANALAHDSIRVAQEGETTAQQILRSEMESVNINGQIQRLKEMVGGSEKEQEARRRTIADLERKEAAEIAKRNQLKSVGTQIADATRQRLVQQAIAQGNHTGQVVRQLTIAEQIRIAERERARILREIALHNGVITAEQAAQLANSQIVINNGRTQQAQASSQEASTRRQNEQTELSMRYANELARARGEAYRTDIDSIDVAQRRSQIEAGLNGLYAYRGNTAQREAARLETIQRLTEQLNNLRGIEEAQQERINRLRSFEQRLSADAANAGVLRAQLAQSNSDRQFANDQARLNQYNDIIQRQHEGVELTQAETEFLSRYNNATRDRILLSGLLDARIEQERANSQDQTLSQEQRIAAEERLNQLLSQRIVLQRQEQERSQKQSSLTSKLGKTLEGLAGNYANVGDAAQGLGSMALNQLGSAFSNMISTVIEGKVSFGEALAEMAKSMLSSLSQMAATQALFQLATGFAKLAINDIPAATAAFTSAGMFAAVAAVAGGISAAIPSSNQQSGGGSGSSGGVSTPTTSTPESSSRNSGPMVINVNVNGSLSTDKDIQKAVAHSVYAYEERMGTRRR